MRILRIIGSTNPAWGGPVEAMKQSVAAFTRLGHTTEIACLDFPGDPWLGSMPPPVHALGQSTRRYGISPRFLRWLGANVRRFDIAVLHGLWNFSSVGARRALRRAGLPYVVFTHGQMDPWFRRAFPLKHAVKDLYWAALESRVLRDASCVFFTSDDERRLARQLYPRARYADAVVRYGTADPPASTHEALARVMPRLVGRQYLLFLSRIDPKKGCDLAVKAFGATARQFPNLDLVMAGPDQIGWTVQLKRLADDLAIGDRIHWPGMLSGEAKWAAFRGAEAFLLPSHSENFGVVVAEALACGTPVLATTKVNIWREVQTCGAGLFAEDDARGMTELVRRYLSLPEAAKTAMRAAARPCFVDNFEINQAAELMAARLQDLVDQHSAGVSGLGLPVNRDTRSR
jgi:glycosyltransferase involved in cell wall biosynthesis